MAWACPVTLRVATYIRFLNSGLPDQSKANLTEFITDVGADVTALQEIVDGQALFSTNKWRVVIDDNITINQERRWSSLSPVPIPPYVLGAQLNSGNCGCHETGLGCVAASLQFWPWSCVGKEQSLKCWQRPETIRQLRGYTCGPRHLLSL